MSRVKEEMAPQDYEGGLRWVRDPILDSWTAKPAGSVYGYVSKRTVYDLAALWFEGDKIASFANHDEAKAEAERVHSLPKGRGK